MFKIQCVFLKTWNFELHGFNRSWTTLKAPPFRTSLKQCTAWSAAASCQWVLFNVQTNNYPTLPFTFTANKSIHPPVIMHRKSHERNRKAEMRQASVKQNMSGCIMPYTRPLKSDMPWQQAKYTRLYCALLQTTKVRNALTAGKVGKAILYPTPCQQSERPW